ncbi:MAG: YebC/PmpR family DNA-binding transcriptional regulator [Patescibacteria group bacterium]
MAGHNKWSQIKRQKGAEDGKKSKLFGILAKTISVEAKKANGDRNLPGLRTAIEKARTANMPNENIDRAIKNATDKGGAELQEVLYEVYGPGGVAILIEGITDNNNRTNQEIKHLLAEHGGNLATPGSVTWAFKKINNTDWTAEMTTEVGTEDREKINILLEELESHEDIKKIVTNLA